MIEIQSKALQREHHSNALCLLSHIKHSLGSQIFQLSACCFSQSHMKRFGPIFLVAARQMPRPRRQQDGDTIVPTATGKVRKSAVLDGLAAERGGQSVSLQLRISPQLRSCDSRPDQLATGIDSWDPVSISPAGCIPSLVETDLRVSD